MNVRVQGSTMAEATIKPIALALASAHASKSLPEPLAHICKIAQPISEAQIK